jgi:hypothetical protein
VANTLRLYRNGAVGFIDWLDADVTITLNVRAWSPTHSAGEERYDRHPGSHGKLAMLWLMCIISEIEHESFAAAVPITYARNRVCGVPLMGSERMIAGESNLTGHFLAVASPRTDQLRIRRALAGGQECKSAS